MLRPVPIPPMRPSARRGSRLGSNKVAARSDATASGRAWLVNVSFVAALLVGSLVAQPAAAGGVSLRIILWGARAERMHRPEAALIAHCRPDQGAGFVLDQSSSPPLLRFEDSSEVWVLQAQPGPRGDTIYRNDVGQPVLRATKLGGLTLFTPDHPDGSAVAIDGEALSIRPPPYMSPNTLFQRLYIASTRSGRAAQKVIPFATVEDATPETAGLIADSASVTAEAITRVARLPNGHILLNRIAKVLLTRGRHPDAVLNATALTVVYAPEDGLAGRPSSERILRAIAK